MIIIAIAKVAHSASPRFEVTQNGNIKNMHVIIYAAPVSAPVRNAQETFPARAAR